MAKPQNYNNHIRFYPPHHFVFYPVSFALTAAAGWYAWHDSANRPLWLFITAILILVIWVAFMLRQHYALILQNRIVLLELRYRYFTVTGERFEPLEQQLTQAQLFALRFAPNDELPALTQKAITENLSAKAIKKSIVNWLPDYSRV